MRPPLSQMPQEEGWFWYRPTLEGTEWRPVRVWWEERASKYVADTRAGNCRGEWGPKITPPGENP